MPKAGLEQTAGIEPASAAWEAAVLPLHHACICPYACAACTSGLGSFPSR